MIGVLPIHKPAGFTSRDVVNRLQGILRPYGKLKLGHTGTLDPLATGVLLVAVGHATRLVEFSHHSRKCYQAEFQLGCQSETLDAEGTVVHLEHPHIPSVAQWNDEVGRWIGSVQQVPPRFSAVHVQGQRAYDLARSGRDFDLEPRTVSIHQIHTLAFDYPSVRLEIECGTGTYVRSIGSDIARALGSDAVMTQLTRSSIGSVQLQDCTSLDNLRSVEDVQSTLLPPERMVEALPMVKLNEHASQQIRNGIPIPNEELSHTIDGPSATSTDERLPWVALDGDNRLCAILTPKDQSCWRSLRVFQKTTATAHPSKIKTPHSPES